jgi:alpha-ketoglutarate-dependent taurine dioxygenase
LKQDVYHTEKTIEFGKEFKQITLKELSEDVDYYAELLVRHKVLHFRRLSPVEGEHKDILKGLFRGEFDPAHRPDGMKNLNHTELLEMNLHQRVDTDTVLDNWHSDFPYHDKPPSITSMHMHTFTAEQGQGNTYFADLEHAYQVCPPDIRAYLDEVPTFLHATGSPPDGTWQEHPALRTHPASGNTCIYYTGSRTKAEGELFEAFMEWIQVYLKENHYSYSWTEGDLTVWDNRNTVHSFSITGWQPEQRVFNKLEYQYEKPYYLDTVNIGDR